MLNVGVPVTKQTVDSRVGGLATRFPDIMGNAEQVSDWISAASDGDLEALGYVTADITALRDAAYAFGVIAQAYRGAIAISPPTDFRVSIRKLAGLG